jgi:hypothetical protein
LGRAMCFYMVTNKCLGIRTQPCSTSSNLLSLQTVQLGTRFRCAASTPCSLSTFIAVPAEQSCTICKHTNEPGCGVRPHCFP